MKKYVSSLSTGIIGGTSIICRLGLFPDGIGKGVYVSIFGPDAVRHQFGPMLPSQARHIAQGLLRFADAAEQTEEEIAA